MATQAGTDSAQPPTPGTPPLIPVEHFFENPEKAGGQISPDGTRLSYLAPEENRLNVWVRTIGEEDDVCVTHDHVRGIMGYFWSRDSKRIIYVQDDGGDENFHVYAADISAPDASATDLTPFAGVRAMIVDVPSSDPDHLLVALNKREPSAFDVHRLTISTGDLELVAENPGNIGSWVTDVQGRLLAAVTQTPTGDSGVLVRAREDEEFRPLREFANEDDVNVYGFTPDGTGLYVGTAEGSDLARLCTLDVTTAELTVVDEDEEADVEGAFLHNLTGELLGAVYTRDRLVFHPLDPAFAKVWEQADAIHPGDIAGISGDDTKTKWVVAFNDDREPGVTYFLDSDSGKTEYLFRPRPRLDPEQLATMTPVRIPSRDGLSLRSYLTLPKDVEAENLPMVLLVHGGPWARDSWGYQPEVQFLANRGYAVLQVNYRGSTGFGKAFMHAAEGEFSGKMHDDLIDAVEWAIAEGYADRSRVAIYGGSYGGYATLVGLSFTPDVFACGIDYVGPSSLVTLIRSFPAYWKPFLQGSWFRFVGDPGTDEEPNREIEAQLLERSPISRVDRIKAPLMVVQGANDPRVTKLESDNIVEALRDRGVEVEYLVKDDEGHGFANPENRLDLYRAMERFFAKHLGGRTSGPADASS
jgi:dipeptidyl aminopeptidase/acylaminoacyl peptidase